MWLIPLRVVCMHCCTENSVLMTYILCLYMHVYIFFAIKISSMNLMNERLYLSVKDKVFNFYN